MKKIYLLWLVVICAFPGIAQQRCASYEVMQQQMAADPVFAKKVRDAERSFDNYKSINDHSRQVITIPVVVHVLYNLPEQNISDAQVQSQIDVLNEDFTASNRDYNGYDAGYGAVKGNFGIRYCLVTIKRVATNHKSFPANDAMKSTKRGGSDAVNPMNALNIWVCNLGQNLLGYAQFPGGDASTFGVVCHYRAFGRGSNFNLFSSYNLGRTMTHEIGHCLGLRHIWGDTGCGNDFVADTPLHDDANFGCPGPGHLSLCAGSPLEMTMDYMDYTDDRCMYFFSDGQVARSSFFLDTDPQLQSITHSSCSQTLLTTAAGSGNGNGTAARNASEFRIYPTIAKGKLTAEFNSSVSGIQTIAIYDVTGSQVRQQTISVVAGPNSRQVNLENLKPGIYILKIGSGEQFTSRFVVQ